MKNKLITGLRTAANALEAGTFFYCWNNPSNCNCGVLFCALTGKSAAALEAPRPDTIGEEEDGTWETLIGQHCPITGMPTQELFKELFGYGLTQQDMINLEYLRDPEVIARMNLVDHVRETVQPRRRWYQLSAPAPVVRINNVTVRIDYKNKGHVIAYMRAWADLLVARGAEDVAGALAASPSHVKC